jgi:putative radical SAM enzyme (TIGR03279 family)
VIVVRAIENGSLADQAGLEAGDRIHAINGQAIADPIDFQVHSADAVLLFEIERQKEHYEVEVERDPEDVMGLEFEDIKLRSCNNKCVFCFIHQMPRGMRRSLYFEDDDYRLSFLHGSYVTLTNIKDKDLDRIIDQGLSPQYLSVHATEKSLRQTLLGRDKPTGDILERIQRLAQNGIEMHAQVVICPGWNDGPHLEQTVHDLASFYPAMRSVALVPVGLTRHRDRLEKLEPVTPQLAQQYLEVAQEWGERFQASLGERFVYLADELFLLNEKPPPPASYYDAFPQIENGIGLVRDFIDSWEEEKKSMEAVYAMPGRIAIITAKLAARFLRGMVQEINQAGQLEVDLIIVENDFFGHGITVSGLLTGEDILKSLKGGQWDAVFLPPNCINGEGLTLDDMTVEQLGRQAGFPVEVGEYSLAQTLKRLERKGEVVTVGQGRQLSELGYYIGRRIKNDE